MSDDIKSIGELYKEKYTYFIPDYQRGYRWEAEQIIDLLNDIDEFDPPSKSKQIYCLQPLIVKPAKRVICNKEGVEKTDDVYDVVDGQQRLTTLSLIMSIIGPSTRCFDIQYQTRGGSREFLTEKTENMEKKTTRKKGGVPAFESNIDYYHIYHAKKTIEKWMREKWKNGKNDDELTEYEKKELMKKKKQFKNTLYNRVCFIWYEVDEDERPEDVFKRINIGKIPLTDAELIKGLFLNRNNFDDTLDNSRIEKIRYAIATEWDKIEYALQDDEFWLFVQNDNSDEGSNKKPTRIEYLLDIIAENNILKLSVVELDNADSHRTYRYFCEAFNSMRGNKTNSLLGDDVFSTWVEVLWGKVREAYQILDEWYHDPTIFHYVGYLITVSSNNEKTLINDLILEWRKSDKEEFIEHIKDEIRTHINGFDWAKRLDDAVFEEPDEGNGSKTTGKGECKDLLLLHNIETIVRRNEYLKTNKKYNLPSFTKFDFHLYKREDWEVEHIRPDNGDTFDEHKVPLKHQMLLYLKYAGYSIDFNDEEKDEIKNFIDECIDKDGMPNEAVIKKFNKIKDNIIIPHDGGIIEEEKNKISNYTLLDKKTNAGYGNYIYQVKRLYLFCKEQGTKIPPSKVNEENIEALKEAVGEETLDIIPFVPPCTKNVFTKYYTDLPRSMIMWTKDDADAYLKNMKELLKDFLPEQKTIGEKNV